MSSNFKERILKDMFADLEKDLGKQYILFILNNLDESGISRTNMMKELFFIAKNIPSLYDELEFEADNYGPNSEKVSAYLEEMSQTGLIKSEKSQYMNKKGYKYRIDSYGKEFIKSSEKDQIDDDLLNDMTNLFYGLTVNETLALTYFNYPEMTEESLVKEEIWNKREKLAFSLYKKNKISVSKASEIAGVPLKSFLKKLKEKGNSMELKL